MNKLLVATDLTSGSSLAFARAIELAAEAGAAIRIVHATSPATPPEEAFAIRKRIATEARSMAEEAKGGELDLSIAISYSDPGDAVMRKAAEHGADLILLGRHGDPGLGSPIFGTTASHVMHHGDWPVLIAQTAGNRPYAKIMVALDDAPSARRVLARVLAIVPAAEELAVHAFDQPPWSWLEVGETWRHHELGKQSGFEARIQKEIGARAGKTSATKHAIVELGDASTILMMEYFLMEPDLLVIGVHRRSMFLGRHAIDALSWCQSDILFIPQPAPMSGRLAEPRPSLDRGAEDGR